MKNKKIFIDKVTTPRNLLNKQITFSTFLNNIKSGKWKDLVLKGRNLSGTNYEKYKINKVPAVWLNHLPIMVIDWEDEEITISDDQILAKFKSFGGKGYAVIVKLPTQLKLDEYENYRKLIQNFLAIKSNERQISNDRARFISFDNDIFVNWEAKPLVVNQTNNVQFDTEHKESFAEQYYKDAKFSNIGLDNNTALSVYSWLRNKNNSHDDVVKEMNTLLFDSKSLRTEKLRLKFFNKWNTQYEYPPIIKHVKLIDDSKIKVKNNFETKDDQYFTDDEYVDSILETAISPFVPLELEFFNKIHPPTTATIVIGTPGSGKTLINNISSILTNEMENLFDNYNDVAIEFESLIKNKIATIKGEENEKKIKSHIPNFAPVCGFSSSDAAVYSSLSELKSMLFVGNEIKQFIGSMKLGYNSTRLASTLEFLEGESTVKVIIKGEFKKSRFFINDPRLALLGGGTPSKETASFFGGIDSVESGLFSRLLFVPLKPTTMLEDKKFKVNIKDTILRSVSYEQFFEFVKSDYKCMRIQYSKEYLQNKIYPQLHEEFKDHLHYEYLALKRGVRNCISRAAMQLWLSGERKKFHVTNDMIDKKLNLMKKSLDYALSFNEKIEDKYGNDLSKQMIHDNMVDVVKDIQVSKGIKVSKKTEQLIVEAYNKINSVRKLSIMTGVSKTTLMGILKKYK